MNTVGAMAYGCIVEVSFIGGGWRKLEYSEKTTDLLQVTEKLDHIKLYWYLCDKYTLTTKSPKAPIQLYVSYCKQNVDIEFSAHDTFLE